MDAKSYQHTAVIYHKPMFQVLLSVSKSYDLLDITRCMKVLGGYSLGAKLQWLLERYWNNQTVVQQSQG